MALFFTPIEMVKERAPGRDGSLSSDAAQVDEPVVVVEHDPRWAAWYQADARELANALGNRLRALEHFGSTAVLGLAAKPIIDILLAPSEWPLSAEACRLVKSLGYEYLGEAGVPGREYFRRRIEHDTNVAVVEFDGPLFRDNLLLRDYLRSHPEVALAYAERKKAAWTSGAQQLLAYSEEKAPKVASLLDAARKWRAG